MDKIIKVEVARLKDNNIRSAMEPAALERLGASLKKGQKFPIVITSDFTIIDGHRRKAAALAAGITHLMAVVEDGTLTPEQIADLQTIHAGHSEAIADYDLAHALKAKKDATGWGNSKLAEFFDLDGGRVTHLISLFACIPAVQEMAARGEIGRTKWYDVSKSGDQEETARLLVEGATRADIRKRGRKAKDSAAPRVAKIKVPLVSGATVTVAGEAVSMEEALESVLEAAKQLKAAIAKGVQAKSAQAYWRDIAAAG